MDGALGSGSGAVVSPMQGTVLSVAVVDGDPVETGTVICVIEAMKTFNEIKAEKRGVIKRIVAEDATPVQFDSHLFEIEPA